MRSLEWEQNHRMGDEHPEHDGPEREEAEEEAAVLSEREAMSIISPAGAPFAPDDEDATRTPPTDADDSAASQT